MSYDPDILKYLLSLDAKTLTDRLRQSGRIDWELGNRDRIQQLFQGKDDQIRRLERELEAARKVIAMVRGLNLRFFVNNRELDIEESVSEYDRIRAETEKERE